MSTSKAMVGLLLGLAQTSSASTWAGEWGMIPSRSDEPSQIIERAYTGPVVTQRGSSQFSPDGGEVDVEAERSKVVYEAVAMLGVSGRLSLGTGPEGAVALGWGDGAKLALAPGHRWTRVTPEGDSDRYKIRVTDLGDQLLIERRAKLTAISETLIPSAQGDLVSVVRVDGSTLEAGVESAASTVGSIEIFLDAAPIYRAAPDVDRAGSTRRTYVNPIDSAPGEARAKSYPTGPLPGGELPEVGTLISQTMAEFTENIGPYALAGLGQLIVIMPVTFLMVFVVYVVIFGGMFGTMIVSAVLGSLLAQISEDLAGLTMALGSLGSMIVPFLLMVPLFVGFIALLAPIQASLVRAVAAHQRGEKPLDLMASFSTVTQGIVPAIVSACVIGMLISIGILFCYLPALLVPVFFGFTTSFAALHGMGGISSARTALKHSLAHLSWYVMYGLISVVIGMVSAYIPVIGPMFAVALHVRAYRTLFGDGAEAVVE